MLTVIVVIVLLILAVVCTLLWTLFRGARTVLDGGANFVRAFRRR